MITEAEPISEFDVDLYVLLVGKMDIFDEGMVIISLLDGMEVECTI